MRPETMGVPDPLHGRVTDPLRLRHRAATPVRLSWRLFMEGGVHYRLNLLGADPRLTSAPGANLGQRVEPLLLETVAPFEDGGPADAEGTCDPAVGQAIRRHEDRL